MQLTTEQKNEIIAGILGGLNFGHLIKLYAVGQNRYGVERQGRLFDPDRFPDGVQKPELIVEPAISGGPAFTAAVSGGGTPNETEIRQAITSAIEQINDPIDFDGVYYVGPGLELRFYLPDGGPLTAELNFVPEQASASIAIE